MSGKNAFGDVFRQARLETGLTLREFCRQNGFDWGYTSKIERGKLPPPTKSKKLEEYAKALRLEKRSAEWGEFFTLASIGAGRIPADIMSDADLIDKLPLLFRTARGTLTPEEMQGLVESIREA